MKTNGVASSSSMSTIHGGAVKNLQSEANEPMPPPSLPWVIDHEGALADIVVQTNDRGIELRLDVERRITWELSQERAIELRDALDAKLPPREPFGPPCPCAPGGGQGPHAGWCPDATPAPRDVVPAGGRDERDELLLVEARRLIEARRRVALAIEDERAARARLEAAINANVIDQD